MSSGPGAMYGMFAMKHGEKVASAVSAGAVVLRRATGRSYRESWVLIRDEFLKSQPDPFAPREQKTQ